MQNSVIRTRITSLYGSQTHLWILCMQNSVLRHQNYYSAMWSQPSPVVLCMQNSEFWTRITCLYGSQTWPFVLCMYDSVISTRITRLYGFQPSSVVLCIQNSDLMTAIACVYGSQTSPVVFCMQNSVPSIRITSVWCESLDPTCGFCMQNSDFWTRITSLYGSQTWPVVLCMHTTAWLPPELLGSMGSSPHLWFCAFKTATYDRNCLCLWVPDLTCDFCMQNSVPRIRITNVCGS